jgi:hypothetical protein
MTIQIQIQAKIPKQTRVKFNKYNVKNVTIVDG